MSGGGAVGGEQEQHPPCEDKGAFVCRMLVKGGCFIFRGFWEKWYCRGAQRD